MATRNDSGSRSCVNLASRLVRLLVFLIGVVLWLGMAGGMLWLGMAVLTPGSLVRSQPSAPATSY